ncbi:toll/interleukin-1 receptor domain-containing protein [Phormidesmis sp. 146-33]
MTDVFLSYSRKDKAFVQTLHDALRAQEREIWVDWDAIPLTADWWQQIERGIEGTNTFVFVISPDSVASDVCRDEIDHAVKHNKRLVPIVRREGFDTTRVHPMLSKYNWLFFRETDEFDRGFSDLIQAIETDLEYVRSHTRILERAIEWDSQNRNESYLLRGVDLKTAETWLLQGASKQPQPTELQATYVSTSWKAENVQRRKQRWTVTAAIAALAAAIAVPLTLAGTILFTLQDRPNVIFAQPGKPIGGNTEYRLTFNQALMDDYRSSSPNTLNQIVFGIPGENESTDCIEVGVIQGELLKGDRSDEHTISLTAPKKAGVYYIHFGLEWQYSCNDAKTSRQNTWKEDQSKDKEQRQSDLEQSMIGVEIVGNPMDIVFHWLDIQSAFNKNVPDQATFSRSDKGTAYVSLSNFSFQK